MSYMEWGTDCEDTKSKPNYSKCIFVFITPNYVLTIKPSIVQTINNVQALSMILYDIRPLKLLHRWQIFSNNKLKMGNRRIGIFLQLQKLLTCVLNKSLSLVLNGIKYWLRMHKKQHSLFYSIFCYLDIHIRHLTLIIVQMMSMFCQRRSIILTLDILYP